MKCHLREHRRIKMASIAKRAISSPAKNTGRDFKLINVSTLTACPALVGGELPRWPELEAAMEAIQTVASIEAVGDFTAAATEVNLLIEGMDFSAGAGAAGYADAYSNGTETWLEHLATLTGETVAEVAF